MKRFNKSAFTLAELMVVLTVIGILAGVLLPVANNARPDENVLKFKKANSTIGNIVRELVSSDKYYGEDLSKKAGASGGNVDATYLCKTMADILNVKAQNCQSTSTGDSYKWVDLATISETNKKALDTKCDEKEATINPTNKIPEIVTSDGIVYYQADPGYHFASGSFGDTASGGGFLHYYKIICVDVDVQLNSNNTVKSLGTIKPFGYGLRLDGKMVSGFRADEWMNCPEQKKEDRPAICKQ